MTPLLQDLLAGSVDVVVGRIGGRALQLPLNYQVLYTEPVCFVASPEHPLAKYATLSWNDLPTGAGSSGRRVPPFALVLIMRW